MKKMLTSSSTPASTANMPIDVYRRVSDAPLRSARSSTVCFTLSMLCCTAPSCASSAASTLLGEARARLDAAPVRDEHERLRRRARVAHGRAPTSAAIVPGATNALFDAVSSPRQKPATPVFGSTRTTRSGTDVPYANASIVGARAGVQRAREVGADHRFARSGRRARDAGRARVAAERARRREVGLEQLRLGRREASRRPSSRSRRGSA